MKRCLTNLVRTLVGIHRFQLERVSRYCSYFHHPILVYLSGDGGFFLSCLSERNGLHLGEEWKIPVIQKPPVKKKSNRKLVTLVVLFFLIVFMFLFLRSSLSKINTIEIVGNELVAQDQIRQALEVKSGDSYFLFRVSKAAKELKKISSLQQVRVTKHFPSVIRVEVMEYPRVAFQLSDDGKLGAVLSNSNLVPIDDQKIPMDKPLLTGWKDGDPLKQKLCEILATIPDPYMSDISEIIPDPSPAWDDRIKIYTRSQFQVSTRVQLLSAKMPLLGDIVRSTKEKNVNTGLITMLEQDRSSGFSTNVDGQNSKETDKTSKIR